MAFGIATVPIAVSVNESVPSGSGLLADLRTFAALGAYPMGVVTAAGLGTGQGEGQAEPLTAATVADQTTVALEHYGAGVVKVAALHTPESAQAVATVVQTARRKRNGLPVVVRPALFSRDGRRRCSQAAQDAAAQHCYPLASLLVCNTQEAALLSGDPVSQPEQLEPAAKALFSRFGAPVLITGGRLEKSDEALDCLWDGAQLEYFASPRILGITLVGLGDTLTAAASVYLMNGFGPADAVAQAKTYLEHALATALPVGPDLLLNPAYHPHPLEPL